MHALAASGWRTPVSLFAHCTQTSAGPAASIASSAARSTSPSLPTGTTPASPPARNAASCSTAVISRRGAVVRPRAIPSDSLAPLVRIVSPRQPWAAAIARRASSSAARAARPSRCGDDGLAHRSNPFATAARAAAVIGVVAA
jgi:hypothetical protein